MLRRRIFSGAMASVMALSSVAVVASAEETQVKTKADLEKLVNETYGDAFRTDKLAEYGVESAEMMLDALEAADAILYNSESTAEDYTVAYMMVEAANKALVIYTAEELQTLIDEWTDEYEQNNILNEELQDKVYTDTTYEAFATAYENATGYVSSTSSPDITDAFVKLKNAAGALEKMDIVTKTQFRNIMRQYETIIGAELAYEDWRRGDIGWAGLSTGKIGDVRGNTGLVSYGILWNACMAVKGDINEAYESMDAIKALARTSDEDIVSGYKRAADAVALFNSWTVDSSTRATKSGVSTLLKTYHAHLVYDFAYTSAEDLFDAIKEKDTSVKSDGFVVSTTGGVTRGSWWENKLDTASWIITPSVNLYVPVDKDGYCVDAEKIAVKDRPSEDTLPDGAVKWQLVSAKSKYELTKLVKVEAQNVVGAGRSAEEDGCYYGITNNPALDTGAEWPTVDVLHGEGGAIASGLEGYEMGAVDLTKAYTLATEYLAGNYLSDTYEDDGKNSWDNDINSIDTTGDIAKDTPKGNSTEWALVYRYLNYALNDRYNVAGSSTTYTRADVKAMIEKAYDLADATGDAAIFEDAHMVLVEARQLAHDWVKEANADKMYKDGGYYIQIADGTWQDSNSMYDMLKKAYDALEAEYNAMKYSFGDIYSKLAEVAQQIDDGELEATASLLTAMNDTALALSNIADIITTTEETSEYDDNYGFTVDREFIKYNRLITNTGDPVMIQTLGGKVTTKDGANPTHGALNAAYTALLAEIANQTAPAVTLGDADGNGTVNALDASEILKSCVGLATVDAAVADYDKNGVVNALDASAILTAIVNGTV